jgi:tetratricopeptide (TPR) repeat protein
MKALLIVSIIFSFSSLKAMTYVNIKKAYSTSYIHESKKNYTKAIKSLNQVYSEYPATYTVNLRLGWLYYLQKKYNDSQYHYEKAIKAMNYSVEARIGYTRPLIALGQFKKAESQCYIILKRDYYNYYGNLRLTRTLRYQKKYILAQYVVTKMLAFYPSDITFLIERALLNYHQGKKKKAKSLFYQILILSPYNKTALNYIGK